MINTITVQDLFRFNHNQETNTSANSPGIQMVGYYAANM